MSKKAKCYAEGDEVELETPAGPNQRITDDVRERAMRAIAAGGQKEEEAPKPKKAAAPKPKKAEVTKEDPEMVKEAYKEAGRLKAEENARESAAFAARSPSKATKADPDLVRRAYIKAAQMQAGKGMKSGGMAKSASARADGCCIRGKTRA